MARRGSFKVTDNPWHVCNQSSFHRLNDVMHLP